MDSELIDGAYALIMTSVRSIGGIIPDVTIEETSLDATKITDHPVEVGAAITDHAFNLPVEVTMRVGWSDSGNFEGYSEAIYGALLQLKAARIPFDISTGKRFYRQMLIQALQNTTDQQTENALIATVSCREIILTSTEVSQADGQGSPEQTGDPSQRGQVPVSEAVAPTIAQITGLRAAARARGATQ